MVRWALLYASLGFKVFPLMPGTKEPYGGFEWRAEATGDLDQILFWWGRVPDANIGIACGAPSGINVFDLDVKGEGNGWESVGALLDPESTPWAQTPSGGYHFYYRFYPALGNYKFQAEGVDIQGTGSYVLAPPSVVDGKPYVWGLTPGEGRQPHCPQAALDWVVARRKARGAAPSGDMPPVPDDWTDHEDLPEPWMLGLDTGKLDGDRSAGLFSLACSLVRRESDDSRILAMLMDWAPDAAEDRRGQDAVTWMWRYVVVPARRQWQGMQARAAEMVTDVTVVASVEPQASNQFDTLRDEMTMLGGDIAKVHLFLAKLVGLSDIYVEALLKDLSVQCGITLKTLRGELAKLVKGVRAQEEQKGLRDEPVPIWERYAYIKGADRIYDLRARQMLKPEAFKKAYNIGTTDLYDEAFIQGKMSRFDNVTYWPGAESGGRVSLEGRECLNTWTPGELVPVEGDATPWLSLFEHAKFPEAEAQHVLDYLAFMLQHPGIKINHGLVIGGAHGIGKDSILEPVKRALGYHNVGTPSGELLLSDFTDWAAGKKLVVFQEVAVANRREARDIEHKLKPVLAAPPSSLSIHPKGLPVYESPNLIQLVVVTNERRPLHVSQGDRRYFMTWGEWHPGVEERRRWTRFWEDLHRWLDGGGAAQVYGYLLGRDVSGFNPGATPPLTEWREEVAEASLSDIAMELQDRLHEGHGVFGWEVVTAEELVGALLGVTVNGRPIGKRAVSNALADLGYQSQTKRFGDTSRVRYYVLREEEKWLGEDVTAAQILGYMKAGRILC